MGISKFTDTHLAETRMYMKQVHVLYLLNEAGSGDQYLSQSVSIVILTCEDHYVRDSFH